MGEADYLIVGLGNPGVNYENTRHNLGFMVVKALAEKFGMVFKKDVRVKGRVASGSIEGKKVHLLMPETYMNLSGQAVRKLVDYFHIAFHNTLVIVDDIYLKLGSMRLRPQGGTGGHKGLKSIESHLRSQEYPRLRMGVGGPSLPEKALEAYVLENFDPEEQRLLPDVIQAGIAVATCWLNRGIEPAAQLAGQVQVS